eukprot:Filipodium_phascolosomae@DN1764_c0_g1_i1.p1
MVWQVDDDLDGCVNWNEFLVMYNRCTKDLSGLEPRQLFNLTQFLMFDSEGTGRVCEEQTLEILYVRFGRERLDSELQKLFGGNSRKESKGTTDEYGEERRINLEEFLTRVDPGSGSAKRK